MQCPLAYISIDSMAIGVQFAYAVRSLRKRIAKSAPAVTFCPPRSRCWGAHLCNGRAIRPSSSFHSVGRTDRI